jgi:hypothetical protein
MRCAPKPCRGKIIFYLQSSNRNSGKRARSQTPSQTRAVANRLAVAMARRHATAAAMLAMGGAAGGVLRPRGMGGSGLRFARHMGVEGQPFATAFANANGYTRDGNALFRERHAVRVGPHAFSKRNLRGMLTANPKARNPLTGLPLPNSVRRKYGNGQAGPYVFIGDVEMQVLLSIAVAFWSNVADAPIWPSAADIATIFARTIRGQGFFEDHAELLEACGYDQVFKIQGNRMGVAFHKKDDPRKALTYVMELQPVVIKGRLQLKAGVRIYDSSRGLDWRTTLEDPESFYKQFKEVLADRIRRLEALAR